jgi:hypothetical protein
MARQRRAPWSESDFERWFERHPKLPGEEPLLPVGRHQAIRRMVDLIALDREGGLVILEVKNESANRKAIGQALEYLSQYDELDLDELADDYEDAGRGDLRSAFKAAFGNEITAVSGRRRIYVVAPAHDAYSSLCAGYLSRHLGEGITFHLATAAAEGDEFQFQDSAYPTFKRLAALPKGFALNPQRRRLFYVIEPGSVPIVWGIGRWREPEGRLTFRAKPSRKVLRPFRSPLLPIDSLAPPRVDPESPGSVWTHVRKTGREATLIGHVRPTGRGTTYVAFAEFRNGTFGNFRRRPAEEFHREWRRTDRVARPWREIVELARASRTKSKGAG